MTSHVPGAVPDQPTTGEQGGGPLHTLRPQGNSVYTQ
jgi:hypothetical protein